MTLGELFDVIDYERCRVIVLGYDVIKDVWGNYEEDDLDLVVKLIEPHYAEFLDVYIEKSHYDAHRLCKSIKFRNPEA